MAILTATLLTSAVLMPFYWLARGPDLAENTISPCFNGLCQSR